MNTKLIFMPLIGVLAVAALAAACGDDDDGGGETSRITTEKGLSVAARGASLGAAGGTSGEQAAAPLARTGGDTQVVTGGGGVDGTTGFSNISADGVRGVPGFAPAPGLQQASNAGITVQGYGSAKADADSAVIEFYFGRGGYGYDKPYPVPAPGGDAPQEGGAPPSPSAEPITEGDLQPVIDALVAQGVARDDIELLAQPYYDPYFSSATLRARVRNVGTVDAVSEAARNAAAGLANLALQSTNVSYTVADCTPLERAAMVAAVEDAGDRGAAFAEVLGVTRGEITGASNYSYTPFSPFGTTECASGYSGPYPMKTGGSGAAQVEVFANIGVTYAIQ
ncbi:MAG: SIMPL domain-containing protein [Dehalococcoidia bacterium]|nr:SIMPL domain-containing protein [Dehalococcoidia bacterium]